MAAARKEIERLRAAVAEQAVVIHLAEGKRVGTERRTGPVPGGRVRQGRPAGSGGPRGRRGLDAAAGGGLPDNALPSTGQRFPDQGRSQAIAQRCTAPLTRAGPARPTRSPNSRTPRHLNPSRGNQSAGPPGLWGEVVAHTMSARVPRRGGVELGSGSDVDVTEPRRVPRAHQAGGGWTRVRAGHPATPGPIGVGTR
jgi:hypothetical protein